MKTPLRITSRHVHIGASFEAFVRQKLGNIGRFGGTLTDAHLVFEADGKQTSAELTLHAGRGVHFAARAMGDNSKQAVEAVKSKMEKQIRRHRRRVRDHRDESLAQKTLSPDS